MVVILFLPPLRERRDDIPLLAYFLLRKFAVIRDHPVKEITLEAMRRLMDYDYPGNVRELSNFNLLQHLAKLTVRVFTPELAAPPATLEVQEKGHILRALEMARGNRSEAARMLGIDRVSLWLKLKKFGLYEK